MIYCTTFVVAVSSVFNVVSSEACVICYVRRVFEVPISQILRNLTNFQRCWQFELMGIVSVRCPNLQISC